MNRSDTISGLKYLKVETGSLVCRGCGYEHTCTTAGCAIIRSAIALLEKMRQEEEWEEGDKNEKTGQ